MLNCEAMSDAVRRIKKVELSSQRGFQVDQPGGRTEGISVGRHRGHCRWGEQSAVALRTGKASWPGDR